MLHKQLSLFDIVNTPGVAADLSHINTQSKVEGFLPPDDGLKKALTGADLVVIPAGVPRKPGVSGISIWLATFTLTTAHLLDDKVRLVTHYDDEYTDIHHDFRDDLFKVCPSVSPRTYQDTDLPTCKINAGIVRDLATGIALASPKAFILVISNPVNSTVPIVAEVLKQHGVFDPKRYHRTLALNHMDYLLTEPTLILGSLVSPPWTSSALLLLSLKSLETSLWLPPLPSRSLADTAA
jgi:malate dehydrogenase